VAKKKAGMPRSDGRGGEKPRADEGHGSTPEPARPAEESAETVSQPAKPEIRVVGIGASAGGLVALKQFFRHVPEDSGLAWVVVVHLSPDHESHLASLLQPHSRMQFVQVSKSTPLKPNCVFVIPPNANLSAIDTHLRLTALEGRRAGRAPIDHFFRTLAETQDGHAIGVVLTGTGSDGTLGVKEIKLRGGLTVAQDPNEAEYDGMPQSAIATGMVDRILPIEAIPAAVVQFAETEPKLPLAEDGDAIEIDHRVLLQRMFALVRARTGRDFTRYKRATIMRRVQRRMQLRYIEQLDRYVEYLRQSPDEVRALADDLLITVTSFFRDAAVFEQLKADVIPAIFRGKAQDAAVRVWCVGCATGEEAYSVLMLLLEEAGSREGQAPRIQMFASDLHEQSLEFAREGFYPGDIASEVSPGRLKRFFIQETGGYRIKPEVRKAIVFAPHNVLADPPFSKLDLIVCRNLLIYLQRDVQDEVLQVFHYALKPGGYLVLGTAETADVAELFTPVDKPNSIHLRSRMPLPEPRLPLLPVRRFVNRGDDGEHAESNERESHVMQPSQAQYEAMHAGLIALHALPSILVGPDGLILHLSAQAGRYLVHPPGRVTANLNKLVREELAAELVSAMIGARRNRRPVRTRYLPVQINGELPLVSLQVRPAMDPQYDGYSLVVFDEIGAPPSAELPDGSSPGDQRVADLAGELESNRERLRAIVNEFSTSQEAMKASNEELQSTNEELRSTMEELETSKEELQSMNEELHTVNQENRSKMEELSQLSNDLQNLLAATDIATLFLDRELRILRFTPKVSELFNARMTDRGRPISDLTHSLAYPDLKTDAENALRKLARVEREVRDESGRWYLVNVVPYRGVDDRIEGVVITFVDVTRAKQVEQDLQQARRTLESRVMERTSQVHDLTVSLVRAEQRERRRLSETLHDELQQVLYGVQLKQRMARDELQSSRPGEAEQQLLQAESLIVRAVRMTRQLSVDLNPPILKNEGLKSILTWLQGQMKELHDLDVEVVAPDDVHIEDSDARVLLFQVFRELLFNVAKHARASRARIALGAVDGELTIGVSDDGQGFDAKAAVGDGHASVGMRSIRERVGLLGGDVAVESAPGAGTTVVVTVPLRPQIGY
jgi:two-component system, chemotaxis family, CheB/CheR fusion protein